MEEIWIGRKSLCIYVFVKFRYIAIISSSAMSSIVFLTSCIIVHKDICLLSF